MRYSQLALALSLAAALLGGQPVAAEPAQAAAPPAAPKLVDINSASRAELKTLPGIGDAEAKRIIAARPYPSKAKLVADQVLSIQAYDALKGRIVALQKTQREPAQPRKL